MQYLKTRDLEAVMALLGVTNPLHARRYVRLAQALCLREDDYVTARATNADEAEELVREGFNFVKPTTLGKIERWFRTYDQEHARFPLHWKFIEYYNYERPHMALSYNTPAEVHFKDVPHVL